MKIQKRTIWGLALSLPAILLLGILSGSWLSRVSAEEKNPLPKFFKQLGIHAEGSQSVFRVYCDVERGNLIYAYVTLPGDSPSSNMVVIKDGCKGEK
jgi:hypothetical protein